MFTGLVEKLASVESIQPDGAAIRLTLNLGDWVDSMAIGDSVSINGCCLTVVAFEADGKTAFEAGAETLSKTTLGLLQPSDAVNVERALKAGERLGGHLVTGHVDAKAKLVSRTDDGEWSTMWFEIPNEFERHLASKGSIAIAGVSLTVVDVEENRFSVALIPHTLEQTTIGKLASGDLVNIETDVLAKYVERQLDGMLDKRSASGH